MVCVKEKDSIHNFKKDPINIYIDGDYIKAKETSLGADNGIGVAIILAILDDKNIKHPKIEAIFTTQEETTMEGAKNLNTELIKGRRLISLDHINEGEILAGAAGIVVLKLSKKIKYENIKKGYIPYLINISGLTGGHSGDNIHLNRANSICLITEIISNIKKEIDIQINSISGGIKHNVIPTESESIIYINQKDSTTLEKKISLWDKILKKRFKKTDENISVKIKRLEKIENKYIDNKICNEIIEFIENCPNGLQSISKEIKGLTESSLNIGNVKIENDEVLLNISIRSSVKEMEDVIFEKINKLGKKYNFKLQILSTAPALKYKKDSELIKLCNKVYKKMYNKKIKIKAIHAGVERRNIK